MSSIASVFNQQAASYERNVREQWDSLEQWERDYYEQFAAWSNDKRAVNRMVLAPEKRGYRRRSNAQLERGFPRTVTLAYILLIAGFFVFTPVLQGAALALAIVNVARGRWGHGLIQFTAALVAIMLYQAGAFAPNESFDVARDLINRYR